LANSAIYNLRENPPVTLLLHGDNDVTINYTQSTLFTAAIEEAGGTSKSIIYPNEEHAFFNKDKVKFHNCLYEMVQFLKENGVMQIDNLSVISENDVLESLFVFPNPASDMVTIKTNKLKDKTNIELYNANGELVMSEAIDPQKIGDYTFSVNSLSNGLYLIRLKTNRGLSVSAKLLVDVNNLKSHI